MALIINSGTQRATLPLQLCFNPDYLVKLLWSNGSLNICTLKKSSANKGANNTKLVPLYRRH